MKLVVSKKSCRRCIIGFGVLLAVIALFLVEEHIRGRIEFNAWMKEMRARGEKFTIAELTPPPTPPEKNGVASLMGAGFITGPVVPEKLPSAMRFVAPGKAVSMLSRPLWAVRNKDILLFTNGVAALWRTNTSTQTPRIRGAYIPMLITREDLAIEVTRNSNGFAQVRAALEYPAIDYGVDYSAGVNISIMHLSNDRRIAQWLRAGSLNALFEANHDTSVQNLVALAALARAKTNELLIISQLVRITLLQIGVAAIWEGLQAEGWRDAQLQRVQSAWRSDNCAASMTRALEMERAITAHTVERFAKDSTLYTSVLDTEIKISPPTVPVDIETGMQPTLDILKSALHAFNRFIYLPAWDFAWKDQTLLRFVNSFQPSIDAGRRQATNSNWIANRPRSVTVPEKEFSLTPARNRGWLNFYDYCRFSLTWMFESSDEKRIQRAVVAETSRELATTAIALRRWEIRHGKRPNSLDELVPDVLPSVPIDPMDGKPLRYRRNPDGTILLYSVGADGKDDGGDPRPPKNDARPQFMTGRDIVWPQRASPEEIEEYEKRR